MTEEFDTLSEKIETIITEVYSAIPNPKIEMIKVKDVKEKIQNAQRRLKEELGDNYFDGVYTSNRYWVMNNKRMSDEKFQDILTMILKDIRKKFNKIFKEEFGEKLLKK